MTASTQISEEPNQSFSSPRSIIICNAPMASESVAKPKKSKGSRCPCRVSRMNMKMPAADSTPTGRLM